MVCPLTHTVIGLNVGATEAPAPRADEQTLEPRIVKLFARSTRRCMRAHDEGLLQS
jgi:hypothetical protein